MFATLTIYNLLQLLLLNCNKDGRENNNIHQQHKIRKNVTCDVQMCVLWKKLHFGTVPRFILENVFSAVSMLRSVSGFCAYQQTLANRFVQSVIHSNSTKA